MLYELLLHVALLGKTVQFLHELGNTSSLDYQDKIKWKKELLVQIGEAYFLSSKPTVKLRKSKESKLIKFATFDKILKS